MDDYELSFGEHIRLIWQSIVYHCDSENLKVDQTDCDDEDSAA